jgi:hypothetical protein
LWYRPQERKITLAEFLKKREGTPGIHLGVMAFLGPKVFIPPLKLNARSGYHVAKPPADGKFSVGKVCEYLHNRPLALNRPARERTARTSVE